MNAINEDDKTRTKLITAKMEKNIENTCRAWGENIDQKVKGFERKIPRPVNALLDALCGSIIIAAAAWLLAKLNLINTMPSFAVFGIVFGALFVISLACRLLIKPGK